MFFSMNFIGFVINVILWSTRTCICELPAPAPSLMLYSPGEPEYIDIFVKSVYDNLTLVCQLSGDNTPRHYVWNYVGENGTHKSLTSVTREGSSRSTFTKQDLQVIDSGHYMCSAPPFSVTKYVLVQTKGPKMCARGAFWCGNRCVLGANVCDGRPDCLLGEDEAPELCSTTTPCMRSDKLNCSSGRCISTSACCKPSDRFCHQQHHCCSEHPSYFRPEQGNVEIEYPPLFEDRHAPDDYGFIQSTIYTVTACALIFMVAAVVLVSAICKMHMKRAALNNMRSRPYNVPYVPAHRFPPCYEASRLLNAQGRPPSIVASPVGTPHPTPTRQHDAQNAQEHVQSPTESQGAPNMEEYDTNGFGLARLSSLFTSRYRQVPTQCLDVEMTDVRSTSLNNSPSRAQNRNNLDSYRSPTFCDLNSSDFYFTNPDMGDYGRDLNYMARPIDFYQSRPNRSSNVEGSNTQRPLTLQLGRFQLSIPRFGRRSSNDRRPDTPNVAEINIEDLDFVRLNSPDTYTLNGRTIRLLGADFENYPVLSDGNRPPPYTEAMRYKLYGPPPEYLSRDTLNDNVASVVNNPDDEARSNIEMPPRYEELAAPVDSNANIENTNDDSVANVDSAANVVNNSSDIIDNVVIVTETVTSSDQIENSVQNNNINNNNNSQETVRNITTIINNLPEIDTDVNANEGSTQVEAANNIVV